MTVVIPSHNKPRDLVRCVQALVAMEFSFGVYEIVVVDDGSREPVEPLLDAVRSGPVPITCVRLEGRGPAGARNAGIRCSRGAVVALCDDDAVPQAGYLDQIYLPFTTDDDVVGVEGAVIPVGGEEFGLLGMSPRNEKGGVYLTCNIAFRREALIRVGGLDENFPFPAFEDCDLAFAIGPLGRIVWAPRAAVHHPRRRWSLGRAIREIQFNEPLVLFARRYGYMGWRDRPTRVPWARVYWSAVVALPLGRTRTGLKGLFGPRPVQALEYLTISMLQSMAASILVIRPIVRGYRKTREREVDGLLTGAAGNGG